MWITTISNISFKVTAEVVIQQNIFYFLIDLGLFLLLVAKYLALYRMLLRCTNPCDTCS
ncbi:hypothetical protein Hanom_Chr07g00631371 [Helianthus anomalus]